MKRPAFTLIELLVVTATVLVLVTLSAAAVSGARSSQRKSQTRVTISKINDILMSQWRTYPSQVGSPSDIRLRITGDLPPNWTDVAAIASSPLLYKTRAQNTYRAFWNQTGGTPGATYADGECLFLSVMYGGFAGCLDCAGLRAGKDFQDTDGDNCPEFIDAWGNPLGFVLWPIGLKAPGSSSSFFNTASGDQLTFTMRPLIFSAGPNGSYGIDVGGGVESNLVQSFSCLNIVQQNSFPDAYDSLGSVISGKESAAADNITNFDAEFRR